MIEEHLGKGTRWRNIDTDLLVNQSSSKVILDVGIHDGFEMFKLAIVQQTEDVSLLKERHS